MELRIVRHTDCFDQAAHFYGDVLGWPVTREWPADGDQGRGRIFGYGDVGRMELIEVGRSAEVAGVFISLEADVADVAQRIDAAGVPVLRPVTLQPWGHRSIAVLDPTGLEVVFWEWV